MDAAIGKLKSRMRNVGLRLLAGCLVILTGWDRICGYQVKKCRSIRVSGMSQIERGKNMNLRLYSFASGAARQ